MRKRWAPYILLAVVLLSACGNTPTPAPRGLYDCAQNTPGTGDLETDIIGKWAFVENSSPQHFTFTNSGNVVRTWNSSETGEVLYTAHGYEVAGDVVSVTDHGDYTFVVDQRGLWSVLAGATDQGWTRCERAGGSAR